MAHQNEREPQDIIKAILNGEGLSEWERGYALWELCHEVDRTKGESRRWTTSIQSIVQLPDPDNMDVFMDDLWEFDWERGNTEYQESEYPYDPYRVTAHKKIVEITEYVPLDDANAN